MTDTPMSQAASAAWRNLDTGRGGPFGAAIVKDGEIVSVAANSVLADNDPTAHAEVNAIRLACEKLGTRDLSGCVLYATGYPCPMCLSAAVWANITDIRYAQTVEEADAIDFRDEKIYKFLRGENDDLLSLSHESCPECEELYDEYAARNKEMY